MCRCVLMKLWGNFIATCQWIWVLSQKGNDIYSEMQVFVRLISFKQLSTSKQNCCAGFALLSVEVCELPLFRICGIPGFLTFLVPFLNMDIGQVLSSILTSHFLWHYWILKAKKKRFVSHTHVHKYVDSLSLYSPMCWAQFFAFFLVVRKTWKKMAVKWPKTKTNKRKKMNQTHNNKEFPNFTLLIFF